MKFLFTFLISDVYVKGYLIRKDKRIAKKKTRICKQTSGADPVFGEVFIFNASVRELSLQVGCDINSLIPNT